MSATIILTIAMSVIAFFISCLVSLLAYIWHNNQQQTDKEMRQLRGMLATNGRHMDSLIHTVWLLQWRVNGIEDWLADTSEFRPPRIIGEAEAFKSGDATSPD